MMNFEEAWGIVKRDTGTYDAEYPEYFEAFDVVVAHVESMIQALQAEREKLKAYEDYDSSPDDAEWEPPHPIFKLAQENDYLRAALQAEREKVAGYRQNAAFYRSCALSGEIPKDGSEPYTPESE